MSAAQFYVESPFNLEGEAIQNNRSEQGRHTPIGSHLLSCENREAETLVMQNLTPTPMTELKPEIVSIVKPNKVNIQVNKTHNSVDYEGIDDFYSKKVSGGGREYDTGRRIC